MESYCVIHFKDKPERLKILTFLASETEADYKVTTDLKKYVDKLFNVTVLENNEEVPSANNVLISPIDTLPIEQQHSSNPIGAPSPIVDKQPRDIETITIKDEIEDTIDNDTILTSNNNRFHNFIFLQPSDVTDDPENLTSMVERKQERIDDEVAVVVDQGNVPKTEDVVVEETAVTNEDVPSTSEGTRKRPNCSMDDDNESECGPTTKNRKNDDQAMASGNDNCQKCGAIYPGYNMKVEHAMMHANIMKYQCTFDGCEYQTSYKPHIFDHMKKNHETRLEFIKQIKLAHKEKNEVDKTVRACFPGIFKGRTCQVCNDNLTVKRTPNRRDHALTHLDIMLYKCMEEGCPFDAMTESAKNKHVAKVHGDVMKRKMYKYALTTEQKLEIKKMLIKCFPDIYPNDV